MVRSNRTAVRVQKKHEDQRRVAAVVAKAFRLFDSGVRDIRVLVNELEAQPGYVTRLYRIWSIKDVAKLESIGGRSIDDLNAGRSEADLRRQMLKRMLAKKKKAKQEKKEQKKETRIDKDLRKFFDRVPAYRKK